MKLNFRTFLQVTTVIFLAFGTLGNPLTSARAAGTIYVDVDATGADDGSSWDDAYPNLQDALAAAASGDQIWVAEGVYYPDLGAGQVADNRSSTFQLVDGVEIYGGFAGTESLLSERDIPNNPTILSGDLEQNDTNVDANNIAETTNDIVGNNAYHVLVGGGTTLATVLDGFTITAGNADIASPIDNSGGGGMFNWNGSPTLRNLTFMGNYGYNAGGLFNYNGANPAVSDSVFSGNHASSGGGATNTLSTATYTNVEFDNNTANVSGGGVVNSGGSPSYTNVTFSNNLSTTGGGGVYNTNTTATFTNVTFHQNQTGSTGGGGMYNTQSSPTITGATFSENFTTNNGNGGAMGNSQSSPTLTHSTLIGNTSLNAAGIANNTNSNMTVANVTFTGNIAGNIGGGFYNGGDSTATIINTTFDSNSASLGGEGLYILGGTITLKNTIIANSVGGSDCQIDGGAIIPNFNLIEATGVNACNVVNGIGNNIIGSDPDLGSLTGSPAYLPLNVGSPAIDAGDDTTCSAAPVNNESQNGVTRPSSDHCDIGSFEKQQTFADVPFNGFAWAQIEAIYNAGITGGCGGGNYCPNNSVTRAQMAVFLLRGIHGSSYTPPAATGTVFNDVGSGDFAAAWIEQMVSEGITSGCGGGNYCPNATVTRAQMAVFLLRAKYGSGYTPPAATGTVFTDVPSNGFAAAWIEQLVSEGVTSGCGGGNYCPNAPVTRAQMAVFLQRTFNLPLP